MNKIENLTKELETSVQKMSEAVSEFIKTPDKTNAILLQLLSVRVGQVTKLLQNEVEN